MHIYTYQYKHFVVIITNITLPLSMLWADTENYLPKREKPSAQTRKTICPDGAQKSSHARGMATFD